jgi:dTDP-4-amino-4,6-dideoxygalactose transaminase
MTMERPQLASPAEPQPGDGLRARAGGTSDPSVTKPAAGRPIPFADLTMMTEEVRDEVEAGFRDVLDSGRFIGGDLVERFEHEWSAYCGTEHAVAVGNGTDALHLALRALGIGPGDEVVVPTNTFVATAEGVILAGATPRFADVGPDTLLLTPETLAAAITPRTRAVIVVHLYGQMADMEAIGRIAASAGLAVIEDAAQAHGASRRGARAGSLSQVGCFSFYPGKNLGAFGDAGAIVTDDAEIARRIRSMRDHGRIGGSHYEHEFLGMNSRMDALQAAVLLAKLPRLESWAAARRSVATRYRSHLEEGPVRLVADDTGSEHGYHLLVARVPDRDRVRRALAQAGIETGLHYPVPCHRQAPYRGYASGDLPVAEQAAGEIVSLPMFPHLATEQITRVCDRLLECVEAAGSDVA